MAHITTEDVEKVAALAKLEFSGEEKEKFTGQFDKIIGFVEKISELNTESIEPTTHAVRKENVFREDEIHSSMHPEEIAAIAPKFSNSSIVIPKVIEY